MSILKNLTKVRNDLGKNVKLIVVTKNRSVREINQILYLGVKEIGESKVQEAKEKKPHVKGEAKWHMIGHLQRNKVKEAVELFDMIQSVDSFKLAKKIDGLCKSKKKVMAVLVQVNIAKEPQKHGVSEEKTEAVIRELGTLLNIKVLGLMAMAPTGSDKTVKFYFRKMKKLFDNIKAKNIRNVEMKYLSMGMTNDYGIAVQEGTNMVRIGTAIFSDKVKT
ncbi:MAG: YggS family pyridoxal phosphate-dependent enzyme [archaeon]